MSIPETLITSLIDRFEKWRNSKLDLQVLERLLLIECRRNRALLDAVKLDCDLARTDDPDLLEIAQLLETAVVEQVFFGGKNCEPLLQKRVDVLMEGDELDKSTDEKSTTVGDLLVRLYIKTVSLQKLSALKRDGEALKGIRYRTRLKNISRGCRELQRVLEG